MATETMFPDLLNTSEPFQNPAHYTAFIKYNHVIVTAANITNFSCLSPFFSSHFPVVSSLDKNSPASQRAFFLRACDGANTIYLYHISFG